MKSCLITCSGFSFQDCYPSCGHIHYMMGTEDKTLLCFCHWGRKNTVQPDGSISYGGGVTDQVILKTGIKCKDFVNAVFDRLGIDPSDKMLHFTVKFDRSTLIRLRDQKGVDALLQFNDGFAHVYASSLEEDVNSRPSSSGRVEKAVLVDYSPSEPDTTPEGDDQNDNKGGVLSKAAVGKLSPHQVNQEPVVGQNNNQNDFSAQFSDLNQHQRPSSSAIQEMFWTKCPTCNIRYRYYSNYVNCALCCQKCSKPFIAFDLGCQDAARRPKQSQPGGQGMPHKSKLKKPLEQIRLPNRETLKMTAGSAGFPSTQTGSQQGTAMTKVDCESRKRIQEQAVESSESDDTSISVETEDVKNENGNNPPAGQGI